jgi:hypothetical protein
MGDIIDFEDYRPAKGGGPIEVSFFGFPFEVDGKTEQLTLNVTVENGDYEGIISAVKENGGWFLRNDNGDPAWFLPWPCAAIRVRPA